MEKLLVSLFALGIALLIIPLATIFGAFAGWIVGLTSFGDWILHALSSMGLKGFTLAQFGALVGFVGAFFRSTTK